MDSSSQTLWSNNSYAPQISYSLYFAEKANFAGFLIGAIFYGKLTHISIPPRSHRVFDRRSRSRRRFVFSVYSRTVRSCKSCKGRYQMGTRRSHHSYVLVFDSIHRNGPRPSIDLIHRQPKFSWYRRRVIPWTPRIPVPHLLRCDQRCSHSHVPVQQLAGGRPLGESCSELCYGDV